MKQIFTASDFPNNGIILNYVEKSSRNQKEIYFIKINNSSLKMTNFIISYPYIDSNDKSRIAVENEECWAVYDIEAYCYEFINRSDEYHFLLNNDEELKFLMDYL